MFPKVHKVSKEIGFIIMTFLHNDHECKKVVHAMSDVFENFLHLLLAYPNFLTIFCFFSKIIP